MLTYDTATALAAVADYYSRARAVIGDDAPTDVVLRAARVLASADRCDADGADAAAAAIVVEVGALQRFARVAGMEVGDVDPSVAVHAWIDDAFPREESRHAPAPDWITDTRSEATRKRSNSGRTVTTVTRHGDAVVVGGLSPLGEVATSSVVPAVAAAMLADVHRYRGGMDGRGITRVTDRVYGDAIPALLGADTVSWEEVIHHEHGAAASDRYGIAQHRADLTGNAGTVGDHYDRSRAPETARHATRLRIPRPVRRKADPLPRTTVHAAYGLTRHGAPITYGASIPSRVIWPRTVELVSGSDRAEWMYVGHRHVPRGETVRKTNRGRRRRTYHESFTLDAAVPLPDALAGLAATVREHPGRAYRWRHGDAVGTLTVSDAGRLSLTAPTFRVRGQRTPRGVMLAARRAVDAA